MTDKTVDYNINDIKNILLKNYNKKYGSINKLEPYEAIVYEKA